MGDNQGDNQGRNRDRFDWLRERETFLTGLVSRPVVELEAAMEHLLTRIGAVQAQLGGGGLEPDFDGGLVVGGAPMTPGQYRDWRRRAKGAVSVMTSQYRQLKQRVKQINRETVSQPVSADQFDGVDALLAGIYRVVKAAVDVALLPPEQQAVVSAAREHLIRVRRERVGRAPDRGWVTEGY